MVYELNVRITRTHKSTISLKIYTSKVDSTSTTKNQLHSSTLYKQLQDETRVRDLF